MSLAINCAIAVVLAAFRIAGSKSPAFQAVSHLFVGSLFATSWTLFDSIETEGQAERFWPRSWRYLALAVSLSLVELGCFLWQRFAG